MSETGGNEEQLTTPTPLAAEPRRMNRGSRILVRLVIPVLALFLVIAIGYLVWDQLSLANYWDASSQFGNLPVFSQHHGISRSLHLELQGCGVADKEQEILNGPAIGTQDIITYKSNGEIDRHVRLQYQFFGPDDAGTTVVSVTCTVL
jgi:hypothetical protein